VESAAYRRVADESAGADSTLSVGGATRTIRTRVLGVLLPAVGEELTDM
jgi:hypothetical protein